MGTVRFLLATSVLYMHYGKIPGTSLLYGSAVVLGFFIISGFYMSLVLDGPYAGPSKLKLFYLNRVLRLFPSYLTVLGLTIIAMMLSMPTFYMTTDQYFDELSKFSLLQKLLAIAPNITLVGLDLQFNFKFMADQVSFATDTKEPAQYPFRYSLVPQAWSISLEIYFYLLAPFIARLRTSAVIAVTLVSLALRPGLEYFGWAYDPWLYRFFPSTICFFLLGMLSHRAYRNWPPLWADRRISIPSVIGLIALPLTQGFWAPWTSSISAYALPDGHLFLWLAPALMPGAFAASKEWKWDRAIGELSYPIYLTHILMYVLTINLLETNPAKATFSSSWNIIIYDSLTVASAILLFILIDRPINKLRNHRRDRAVH